MSNFSDREDHHLLLLARSYEDLCEKVAWNTVAAKMKYSKKTARALKRRLETLKSTHGKRLCEFPPWLFRARSTPSVSRSKPNPLKAHSSKCIQDVTEVRQIQSLTMSLSTSGIATKSTMEELQATTPCHQWSLGAVTHENGGADSHDQQEVTSGASPVGNKELQATLFGSSTLENSFQDLTYKIVAHTFNRVRKADVRQVSGRTELNVGELTMEGVTRLIAASHISANDVFLDIGSGIGNVVVQVALQCNVKQAIGIEIRQEVASLGLRLIQEARQIHPQLSRVCVFGRDICDLEEDFTAIANATVLYTNNYLFVPGATLAIQRLCCRLQHLRVVVMGAQACPRHRPRCTNEFCFVWKEQAEILYVGTEFRQAPFQLYTYIKA